MLGLLPRHANVASGRALLANSVGASPETGRYPASLHSKLTPPPAVSYHCTQVVNLLGGAHTMPPYIVTPTPPPVVFYRRTKLVPVPEGAPNPLHCLSHRRRPRPCPMKTPCGCISRESPCKVSLYRNAKGSSHSVLPANLVDASTGRGQYFASLIWHAHASSCCVLPAQPVGTSSKRGLPPYIGTPTPYPVVSYCRFH